MTTSTSTAIVPYRPHSSSSQTLASFSSRPRLFSAATGTAIVTELLYRILVDLVNRLIYTLQDVAAKRIDRFYGYLEKSAEERREMMKMRVGDNASGHAEGVGESVNDNHMEHGNRRGLGIMDRVRELHSRKSQAGFGQFRENCPISAPVESRESTEGRRHLKTTGTLGGPPFWVASVLKGVEEGRMQERDFWIQTHGD